MSGAHRRTGNRAKNVRAAALGSEGSAELAAGERYARVLESRGGNLFAVELPPRPADGELAGESASRAESCRGVADAGDAGAGGQAGPGPGAALVLLPAKFNRVLWLKRGSPVVIALSPDTGADKIAGEIRRVLYPQHVRELRRTGVWPKEWDGPEAARQGDGTAAVASGGAEEESQDDDASSDDGLPPIEANCNRRPTYDESDEEDDSEEDG